MHRDNELLPDGEKKEIPKLEDMTIHNWQAAAIGDLHEAAKAHLLGNLFEKKLNVINILSSLRKHSIETSSDAYNFFSQFQEHLWTQIWLQFMPRE